MRSVLSRTAYVIALLLYLSKRTAAQSFTISPGWACDGDRIAIRWTGAPGAKPSAFWESQGSSGTIAFAGVEASHILRGTTTLRLTSDRPESQVVDTVHVHEPTMEHEWTRPAACAGRLSTASMAIPPARASDRIKPRTVTNRGTEPVLIWHRGHAMRLEPGESTTSFNGLAFSGDWGAVVDTGPYNAACPAPPAGSGSTPAAPKVQVVIVTACARN
jgi:hypothetical protein